MRHRADRSDAMSGVASDRIKKNWGEEAIILIVELQLRGWKDLYVTNFFMYVYTFLYCLNQREDRMLSTGGYFLLLRKESLCCDTILEKMAPRFFMVRILCEN